MVFKLLFAIVCVVLLLAGTGLTIAWTRLGGTVGGSRLDKIKESPNFRNGKFQNPIPTDNSFGLKKIWETLKDYSGGQKRIPDENIPIVNLPPKFFSTPPTSGLRITWLGHSSVLIEIDGYVVLFDPVFRERASFFTFFGPKRFHAVPLSIADMPKLDAVIISHDHYDHLDYDTVVNLTTKTSAFYLPLGVGAHLEYWKIPQDKIVEMDWWEEKQLKGGLRLVALPARHFSGRMGFADRTQWASWAIVGPSHRVFFSGDTGIMPLFKEVGEQFGPFDVTLIKIGAYGNTWPDIHTTPEEAVTVHHMVRGKLLIPIHWGTFNLSYHAWTEPAERLLSASENMSTNISIPQPGQPVDPESLPPIKRWWANID